LRSLTSTADAFNRPIYNLKQQNASDRASNDARLPLTRAGIGGVEQFSDGAAELWKSGSTGGCNCVAIAQFMNSGDRDWYRTHVVALTQFNATAPQKIA
jgi:hypothetical protein